MNTFTQQLLDVLTNLDEDKFNEFLNMIEEFGTDEETLRDFGEVVVLKREELCDDDDMLGKACLYFIGKLHGKGETQ